MAQTNVTDDENQKLLRELWCLAEFIRGVDCELIFLSAVNIFLSITALQGTLVACYVPFGIVVALTPQQGMALSVYLSRQFTATLLYLNSSLNPLLHCLKIREVRRAVKETLRQLFCRSS